MDRAILVKVNIMNGILVVDDEPLVRMLAEDALEEAGYRVFGANSAAAAREILRE